jgi:hypothetical protein
VQHVHAEDDLLEGAAGDDAREDDVRPEEVGVAAAQRRRAAERGDEVLVAAEPVLMAPLARGARELVGVPAGPRGEGDDAQLSAARR